jgi:hypothetical protein
METDQIIEKLNNLMVASFRRDPDSPKDIIPVAPIQLSNNLLHIRGLLLQLVDKVADSERDYRLSKAAKYDELIKTLVNEKPMSRSAASDQLDYEPTLIEKKIATERVRNFMKYVDGLCTSMQSVLRVQAGADKSQY